MPATGAAGRASFHIFGTVGPLHIRRRAAAGIRQSVDNTQKLSARQVSADVDRADRTLVSAPMIALSKSVRLFSFWQRNPEWGGAG